MENITLQPQIMAPFGGTDEPVNAHDFIPKGVCAKLIRYAVEDGKLTYVKFTGGCDGNLKAVSTLVTGMKLTEILSKLKGITCGNKPTSCADQLCCALSEYLDSE
ncbi:TIGR03905 family TSCPD domain-containing protein [Maridesulfovibrio zosterae]|uniref:TIGR03905 family TSCPD domain-containing protein n=1 Tax=Maridesulfovibrio zosterae TaxID=82171 RepID=UPI00041EA2BE|nr:TIGR03905 family TSCPD domain-containing protein [Maridesulfovibrio zosterae]